MKIYSSVDELIGKTPLVRLFGIEKKFNTCAKIVAKLEFFNPAGSVKDRVGKAMIDKAEREGKIDKETVIIEPTSGNTGIGLASVAASRGYKLIIVMPDSMSIERRKIMSAYGAELVLTDGSLGMRGAIEAAENLKEKIGNAYIPSQFENPENPKIHYETTGPEIYNDTDGVLDFFVAGVGTGGTVSGVGKYLKEKNPSIKIIAVEPAKSAVLTGGSAAPHGIQGIGAGFVPKTLDTAVYDSVIKVEDSEAFEMARLVGKTEGFTVGISSGAALFAAVELAKREELSGKTVVVLFPDSGDRYLSTLY